MGKLTTHVLDTSHGRPAAGVSVKLFRVANEVRERVFSAITNSDGRCNAPLLEAEALIPGQYELVFGAGDYFRRAGVELPTVPFIDDVIVRFGISDRSQNYHVPLLMTPWSYSTYRGS
jgi:5-hydroxyisourate hydrolase